MGSSNPFDPDSKPVKKDSLSGQQISLPFLFKEVVRIYAFLSSCFAQALCSLGIDKLVPKQKEPEPLTPMRIFKACWLYATVLIIALFFAFSLLLPNNVFVVPVFYLVYVLFNLFVLGFFSLFGLKPRRKNVTFKSFVFKLFFALALLISLYAGGLSVTQRTKASFKQTIAHLEDYKTDRGFYPSTLEPIHASAFCPHNTSLFYSATLHGASYQMGCAGSSTTLVYFSDKQLWSSAERQ